MHITVGKSDVLHGKDRYKAEEDYDVNDSLGRYFVTMGWATSDEFQVEGNQSEVADLEVQDGFMGTESEI